MVAGNSVEGWFFLLFCGNIAYLRCVCAYIEECCCQRLIALSPRLALSLFCYAPLELSTLQKLRRSGEQLQRQFMTQQTKRRCLAYYNGSQGILQPTAVIKRFVALDHFMAIGNTRANVQPLFFYNMYNTQCGEPILVSLSVGCQRLLLLLTIKLLFESWLMVHKRKRGFYA